MTNTEYITTHLEKALEIGEPIELILCIKQQSISWQYWFLFEDERLNKNEYSHRIAKEEYFSKIDQAYSVAVIARYDQKPLISDTRLGLVRNDYKYCNEPIWSICWQS